MKKLVLVAMVASFATAAFAQKHMVRFYDFDNTDSGTSSFDVSMMSDNADDKDSTTNIALNYAYAINNMWQVGATYKSRTGESGGNDFGGTTMGLSGYYNVNGDLTNTHVIGLHYLMHSASDGSYEFMGGDDAIGEDDSASTIALEYGHRWQVGSAWGFNLTYSPTVTYAMTSYDWDVDANDDANGDSYTSLTWNFLKFDVLF